MATIKNKRRTPLSINLPGGKKLRLGPLKSGEISPKAANHPSILKLVAAGAVEVFGSDQKPGRNQGPNGGNPSGGGSRSHGSGAMRQSGDR